MVMELDEDNQVIDKYIRGKQLIKSGLNGYYLYNAHRDVIQLADQQGTVTRSYLYDAFGVEQGTQPNDTNPFRYCGEYLDNESGNVYLRARYYDPAIGRFISEDSIKGQLDNPLTLNLYAYCGNNPVNWIDPSGNGYVWNRYGEVIGTTKGDDYTDKSQEASDTHGGSHLANTPWTGGSTSSKSSSGSSSSKNNSSSGIISSIGSIAASFIGGFINSIDGKYGDQFSKGSSGLGGYVLLASAGTQFNSNGYILVAYDDVFTGDQQAVPDEFWDRFGSGLEGGAQELIDTYDITDSIKQSAEIKGSAYSVGVETGLITAKTGGKFVAKRVVPGVNAVFLIQDGRTFFRGFIKGFWK